MISRQCCVLAVALLLEGHELVGERRHSKLLSVSLLGQLLKQLLDVVEGGGLVAGTLTVVATHGDFDRCSEVKDLIPLLLAPNCGCRNPQSEFRDLLASSSPLKLQFSLFTNFLISPI